MSTELKKVMVIGGGIAGLTAAWELTRAGIQVELVEKSCFLGGHAIGYTCKASDHCLQCGACSVEEMLKNVVNEPLIQVHLATEVETVTGTGPFIVELKKSAPAEGSDPILRGYSINNNPLHVVVDKNSSGQAPEGAVPFDDLGTSATSHVDSVILASGFKPFDADIKSTYGHNKFPNVVTGLELERIKREKGDAVRPSDGKVPEKIAFIQCVGSRDERLGNLWCSHVCCPYALRCAESIKHKNPDSEITIFYMDIQTIGKEFPIFYEQCKSDLKFVRNIPVDVYPIEDDRMSIRHLNDAGEVATYDEFDLVVLSIGIMPGLDSGILSEKFGIGLDQDGFFEDPNTRTGNLTSKTGIFMAGTCQGPKTIAASMAHSGQAACEAMKYLGVTK